LANSINLVEQQQIKIHKFLTALQYKPEYEFVQALKPKVIALHGEKGENIWFELLMVILKSNI